ncbi:MAG: GRRM system radical SAM/SPASM domain protein [Pandoraea sp.]|nr:cyclophane-forming radical SAM/SPASM peptide maturase GrrM/OscB [Pandoraea sp.]MDR3398148.1 GRRM system radical SAM/SPASM domain protein [Pandoraea sp.]
MKKPLIPFGPVAERLAASAPAPNVDAPTPTIGPTRLVILQPTSFCNIDCSYCYVPDRQVKGLMSMEVLGKVFDRLVEEDLLGSRCSVVWHAGEPLTAGKTYFAEAFALAAEKLGGHTIGQLTTQTNGTLIDEDWLTLFRDYKVRVGVSLDGPKHIHDMHRRDRKGRGSFDATVRGLQQLQAGGVDNYVLSVVTRPMLGMAREFYEFFEGLGVGDVGLIPEEVDGINAKSSLDGIAALRDFEAFTAQLHDVYQARGRKPEIREFRGVREALFYNEPIESLDNNKTVAYHILTVAKNGGFTTFSPELVGMPDGADYTFGNILTDSLRGAVETEKFRHFYAQFMRGVARCRDECDWFTLCGGGLPSNKLSEAGSLEVSETMSCQLHIQTFARTVLGFYNQALLGQPT